MILPFNGHNRITQKYKGASHKGIDIVGDDDKTLLSVCEGVIEKIAWDTYYDGGMGYYIRIKRLSNGHRFYYAHCLANSAKVKVGQSVKVGTPLAVMGNTGHSNGAHLHLEERVTTDNSSYTDITKTLRIENKYPATYIKEKDMTKNEVKEIVREVLTELGINDNAEAPSWATAWEMAKEDKVTDGTGPNKPTTRAQTMQFIYRESGKVDKLK